MAANYKHSNTNKKVNNDICQYMSLLVVSKDISCGKYKKIHL